MPAAASYVWSFIHLRNPKPARVGGVWSAAKRKKAPAVTEVDKAMLDLKVQKRRLADYQRKVEAAAAVAADKARQLVAARSRDRALVELRRKKYMVRYPAVAIDCTLSAGVPSCPHSRTVRRAAAYS